jgi:hypothetical protein
MAQFVSGQVFGPQRYRRGFGLGLGLGRYRGVWGLGLNETDVLR